MAKGKPKRFDCCAAAHSFRNRTITNGPPVLPFGGDAEAKETRAIIRKWDSIGAQKPVSAVPTGRICCCVGWDERNAPHILIAIVKGPFREIATALG